MRAAKDLPLLFDPVSNDFTPTARTSRRHCVDSAFKAVKDMGFTLQGNLKAFVVLVTADFAFRHSSSFRYSGLYSSSQA